MKRRVLGKTTPFHALLKKRREKAGNGAVLNDTHVFFFPWTREAGEEEEDFFFCSTASSL